VGVLAVTKLRDGSMVDDVRLDRLYELDWRSLDYPVTSHPKIRTATAKPPRSFTWSCDVWLDQGQEGACVGFGFSHDLRAKPKVVQGITNRFAREQVYWEAQKIDPWSGGAYPGANPRYEGTAVLAGAKVLTDLGFYSAYTWALTIEQVVMGIAYAGPAIFGFDWYSDMSNPDDKGFIHATGFIDGGHCILGKAVKIEWKAKGGPRVWANVDLDRSYITLHNSWGKDWGTEGTAKISLTDVDMLLKAQGDACFPVRTAKVKVP
jgi:hypothetical protein